MTTPIKILKKYRIHPAKRFGQCFLIDGNVMEKIVGAADIGENDTVVEIGAGIGVMTGMLAQRARFVQALDIDPRMIDVLNAELLRHDNVSVLQCDILNYNFNDITAHGLITIVGNIPYNISSQIFFHLLNFRKRISKMVLMFQKEVGERIIAQPGTKDYGIMSVVGGLYTEARKVTTVSPGCFTPPPKVESVVLKFAMRKAPLYPVADEDLFVAVVKTAFGKRRKTIMNNLKFSPVVQGMTADIGDVLNEVSIHGGRRGETLSTEEFVSLTNALYRRQNA